MLHVAPPPALAPYVEMLWYSDETAFNASARAVRERALPTGSMNLVVRLSDAPIRVFADLDDERGDTLGHAVVAGARARFFVKDTARPSISLGVHFRPGGAAAWLGVPADELSGRHTRLEELWGSGADALRERLLACAAPAERIACFQAELVARTDRARVIHPAVAGAVEIIERQRGRGTLDAAWRASGYSRRHFFALFEREVGLGPKVFARIRRFQGLLPRAARTPRPDWSRLALEHGWYDQSHLVRDFRAFAGIAPGAYRPLSPRRASHVPIDPERIENAIGARRSIPSKPGSTAGT